ncbi:MAG: hypothetical protein ACK45B_15060 [Limisphaerales bacterium]
MTTIVKADQNRIPIKGVRDGMRYLVREEASGWWVEPVTEPSPAAREIRHARKTLCEHLDALAAEGFEFSPSPKEEVPPCRF